MADIFYRGLLPKTLYGLPAEGSIRRKDEEGNDFVEWDGETLFNNEPSRYSDRKVTVYGGGTHFCLKLTRQQVAELYWRMQAFALDVTPTTGNLFSFSASASGADTIQNQSFSVSSSGSSGVSNLLGRLRSDPENPEVSEVVYLSNLYLKRTQASEKELIGRFSYPSLLLFSVNRKDGDSEIPDFKNCAFSSEVVNNLDEWRKSSGTLNNAIASVTAGVTGSGLHISAFDISFNYLLLYWPSFIQTGQDEYWWHPPIMWRGTARFGVGAVSFQWPSTNVAEISIFASGGSYAYEIPGWTIDPDAPPEFQIENPLVIRSLPIEVYFSDGSIVTGGKYISYRVTGNKWEYDANGSPQLLGTLTSADVPGMIAASMGNSSVTLTFDPDVAVPEKVTLSAYKYFSYKGMWDEETGLRV